MGVAHEHFVNWNRSSYYEYSVGYVFVHVCVEFHKQMVDGLSINGYKYGIMLRVRDHATSMASCYEYGIMLRDHSTSIWIILRVWRHTTSMGSCYEYGIMLRVWGLVTSMEMILQSSDTIRQTWITQHNFCCIDMATVRNVKITKDTNLVSFVSPSPSPSPASITDHLSSWWAFTQFCCDLVIEQRYS